MSNKQITTLKIPQMGEGLRQVKITKFLKKPGDFIQEDEVIYEMETDKSVVEIESPFTGYLEKWLDSEHNIVDVGSAIAMIKIEGNHNESPKSSTETKSDQSSIPPRVLRYCVQKGLSNDEINLIPNEGKSLSIQDVDNYVSAKKKGDNVKIFSPQQSALIRKFRNSESQIIASSTVSLFDIKRLKDRRKKLIKEYDESLENISVTDFQVFAYIISKVSKKFSKLRSRVISDTNFIEDKQLYLGVATQSLDKELYISVLELFNDSAFDDFIFQFYEKVGATISAGSQAIQSPHIVLSYLGSESKILYGAPVLVYPSVATIFLGGSQKDGSTHISVTFDHRIINGSDVEEIINEFLVELS